MPAFRVVLLDAGALTLQTVPDLYLGTLQELVDGPIQVFRGYRGPWGAITGYCNEEAILTGLPPNVAVPGVHALGGVLRGPVLLCGADVAPGGAVRDRGLTDAELGVITVARTPGQRFPTLLVDGR